MTSAPAKKREVTSRQPRGAWRTEIDLRVRELRNRLKAAEAEPNPGAEPELETQTRKDNPAVPGALPASAPERQQRPEPSNRKPGEAHPGAPATAQTSMPRDAGAADASSDGDGLPPSAQRLQATTRSALITLDVHEVPIAPAPTQTAQVRKARVEAIQDAIDHASEAIEDATAAQRIAQWWTGSAITAGWESVHGAEAELVDVESEADVRASLPHLATWLAQVMPSGEPRERYEGELKEYMDASKPLDRTTVRLVYKDVVRANNESKANLRAFRNLLTLATAALAVLLIVLAIWHAIDPEFVSLCGTSGSGATSTTTCLSGSSPRGQDLIEVELLGAIGGLLSLAVAFSGTTEAPPSRYNVRPQQAALKVVTGAATGLIGVLIVQSGVIVSPASQTSSQALFLVYAAVFGFSQQLFTKFVDKRAEALLGETEETGKKGSSSASATKV